MLSYLCSIFLSFLFSCNNAENTQPKNLRTVYFVPKDNAHIYVNMKNSPQASAYIFYAFDGNGKYQALQKSGIIETNSKPEFSHELNENDDNIVLYIDLEHSYNTTCATRPVVRFKKKQYPRENAKPSECLTRSGCLVDVNWDINCGIPKRRKRTMWLMEWTEMYTIAPPIKYNVPSLDAPSKPKDELLAHIIMYGPTFKPNETRTYYEGETLKFKCTTDYKSAYLTWIHKKDEYILSRVTGNIDYPLQLILNLTRYDDNTSLVCITYDSLYKKEEQDRSREIILKWNETTRPENYDDKISELITADKTYYRVGEKRELMCSLNDHYHNWLRIKNNKIDHSGHQYTNATVLQYILQLNMSIDDDGAHYMCYRYKSTDVNQVMTRIISGVTNFVIQPNNSSPVINPLVKKPENLLIYYGIGGLILAVILCFGLWKISSIHCRQSNNTTLEVETYACPTTVRYVDLQAMSTENANREVNRDDTPYAQIIGFLEPTNK